jgi:hypothetical protein
MANLRAVRLQLGLAPAVLSGALTLASFGLVLRRGSFADKFSAAILTSLLLSPHTYRYDLSLLAIVAFLANGQALRYILLLRWLIFYPRLDLLPMVFLSLGYQVAYGTLRQGPEAVGDPAPFLR